MFYSQFILAKKGPLGTIWIAAHLERKLRKNQIADTDIGDSVDSILFPEVPIALRLSSHLLLGVVRIYSKKVNYLFDDCSDALLKVKQAFRSTAVDLPPEQSKAPYHSITLPETFDLDDFELPDNEVFQGNFVDHHVSTREQITLQDTMDGVAFPTSQFGPDERFGDGDASQIGLDLDEELFMDKVDAAGASEMLIDSDAGPQASVSEASPSKVNEHNEEIFDPPLASSSNHFVIQAPSTPGLTEEPNLPSTKEEIQGSDDHMDEDPNPCELAAKEVSGHPSSPAGQSDFGGAELHSNGDLHHMVELDNEKVNILKTESTEFISSDVAQTTSNEHIDVINGPGIVGNTISSSALENEGIIATDIQTKGRCEDAEININGTVPPEAENATLMEVEDADCNKTELNGNCHPLFDSKADKDETSVGLKLGTVDVVASSSEHNNTSGSCLNLNNGEASESKVDEKSSGVAVPFLQACTSKVSDACDGAINKIDASSLPAQDDGLNSIGILGREDSTVVIEMTANVGDVVEPNSKAEQTSYGVTSAGGQLDNLVAEENYSEKENKSSDFPPPEVLRSMPNPSVGLSDNFLVDFTPGKEVATDGDAVGENAISGRKRSFTESTLTVQSFNSVESPGGAQSKGTEELIPDDNDLLSSILAGKRSTTFKMKPTPPVSDTIHAKRQRTAVRSVAHKRKLLVDDSTVLHGDTIRQQLTNTEDIRRVRKKAPCTNLEVWVLQKQFLEDEVFSEPVFTGMFPALRSLYIEAFDLHGIKVFQEEGNRGVNLANISAKPTINEEAEAVESLVPVTTDASVRPNIDENTEAVGTLAPFILPDEGLLGTPTPAPSVVPDEGLLRSSLEPLCEKESMTIDRTLLKDVETVDNEVLKQISECDAAGGKAETVFPDVRTSIEVEASHSVASIDDPITSVGHDLEVACNSTDYTKVNSPSLKNSGDVLMPLPIDASDQLIDQRCNTQCSMGDASTAEDVSGSGIRDQGVEIGVSEKVDLDDRSDGEHSFVKREGVDTDVVMGHFQDLCSLSVDNFGISDSMALEDRACPISDHVVENVHLDQANKGETSFSGPVHDGSFIISDNVDEHLKLDSSYSAEADLSSQFTKLDEREEGREHWEAEPMIVMDSTPVPTEFMDSGNIAEIGTVTIEHDTDFLNVDDDDAVEDYESDVPDHEERRILDNSGWSARTRAVANYLQGLFEKESVQAKKAVSLDNLLVGKSRKEASRMFFETLVLKTKDYVQAEQECSFADIKIKPRGKLLKSEF